MIANLPAPGHQSHGIAPGFTEAQTVTLFGSCLEFNLDLDFFFERSGDAGYKPTSNPAAALAPILYDYGQIFGALVLAPTETLKIVPSACQPGFGVYGLVYGVIIGALLHLLIQVPGLSSIVPLACAGGFQGR